MNANAMDLVGSLNSDNKNDNELFGMFAWKLSLFSVRMYLGGLMNGARVRDKIIGVVFSRKGLADTGIESMVCGCALTITILP